MSNLGLPVINETFTKWAGFTAVGAEELVTGGNVKFIMLPLFLCSDLYFDSIRMIT